MIKINLLPSYILERHRIRRMIWWMVTLLVIELLAFGFTFLKIRSDVAAAEERLDYWTREANKVTAIANLTNQVKARTAPYTTWLNWFTGLEAHNVRLADLIKEVSTYVYNRVQLSAWDLDNAAKTITLTGKTDSLESLARYYLNMLRGPFTHVELQTTVSGWNLAGAPPLKPPSAPGGLPLPQHLTLPVTLVCTMEQAVVPPAPPSSSKEAVGAGAPAPRPGAPSGDDDDDDDDDDE